MALFNGIRLGVGFLLHSLGVALRLARFAPAALLRAARPEGARKPTAGAPGGPLVAESNPLLLLYSQVSWHGVWQRPQEMALGLARRRRVLFVSPIQVHERLGRYARARTLERIDGGYLLECELSDGRVLALLPADDSTQLSARGLTTTGAILVQRHRADGAPAATVKIETTGE